MSVKFVPRLTRPESKNPFYNTKSNGGYSTAIIGSPTDPDCNVLSNCSGYTYGRTNEISNNTKMTILEPRNGEVIWDVGIAQGLKTGQVPKLGAVMVWQKGATRNRDGKDGAGHACVVEQIISDTEVVTSESGWNASKPWWLQTRKKGSDGNWGQNSDYKFLGFIYHPDLEEDDDMAITQLIKLTDGTSVYDVNDSIATLKKDVKVSPTGVYTIISKKTITIDEDVIMTYGKLKSGIGWVVIDKKYIEHQEGSTGKSVKLLQQYLINAGYLPKNQDDGIFGKYTMSAVCGYQHDHGLEVTGIYDSNTRQLLTP